MPDKLSPVDLVRKRMEYGCAVYQPYWEAMRQEAAFLSGDRYEKDNATHNRDRRRIKIRGQATDDTIRHVVAKIANRPRNVEARPVDNIDDPEMAEVAVSLLERDTTDPFVGFDREFYAALVSSCETRLGVVFLDWDPTCGPFGKRLFSWVAPDRVLWDPAWHPHHPKCEWLTRIKRLNIEVAREKYKNPNLYPDRDCFDRGGHYRGGADVMRINGETWPRQGDVVNDDKITLWEHWIKNDHTQKPSASTAEKKLEAGQRYMLCEACLYRSQTEATLKGRGAIKGGLPTYLEGASQENPGGGCPECGGALERVDVKATDEYQLAYNKGKRLIVVAPYGAGDNQELEDTSWPIPEARSFPALFLVRYVKPGCPMGPSDVTKMWDQQIAADQLDTLALQRVFEHRNYWKVPRVGIYNWKGERFGFRDDDFNVMYEDTSKQFQPHNVQNFNGTGLDPSWPLVRGQIDQALTRYRPQLDIGPAETNTRDIAVGTIERQVAEAEISTEDFRKRINRDLSMFYGVLWDYIRETLTYDEASRLRIDGIDMVLNLMGDSLPNYDVVVEESPDFSGIDEKRSQALDMFLGAIEKAFALGLDPIEMVKVVADLNPNIPRSVLRRVEKMVEQMQAQADAPIGEDEEEMAAMEAGLIPPAGDQGLAASMNGSEAPVGEPEPALPY